MPAPGLEVGEPFLVVGNTIECAGTRIGFLGAPTGRELIEQPQPRQARAGSRRETWPAEYPDRARELHAGLSCPKVAAELGVPFGTAKLWLWPGYEDSAAERLAA